MGRSEKVPPAASMSGATQETRATSGDDGQGTARGGRVELSAAHTAYLATINRDELPSVEEALARLSGVMQDGVEWLMAQEMAEAAEAERTSKNKDATTGIHHHDQTNDTADSHLCVRGHTRGGAGRLR